MQPKSISRILTFAVLLLIGTALAFAQQETGTVSGTVTDPQGAVVPNAQITLTNVGTNQTRTTTTNANGLYSFSSLQPTSYEVSATSPGFGKFKQRVDVFVGSRSTVDAKLSVQGNTQVVEVTAEAGGQVDTQTQTLGQTVTATQIAQLPSLNRDPYDFAATAGNVSEGDNGGRGVGISINGQRSASTNILLDGAENVDLFNAQVGQPVPLDSVQEFKILTSGFTAEYGRASGGVVNVATKSGSNQFHGSLYEYNRISALASQTYDTDSNNFVNRENGLPQIPKARFVRNQFGYALGGPIKKDKLFFFSSTEWVRVRSNANIGAVVFAPDFIAMGGANTTAFFNQFGTLAKGVSLVGAPITAGQIALGAGIPNFTKVQTLSPNFVALATVNPGLPVLQQVSYSVPSNSGGGDPQNTYDMVHRVDYNLSDRTSIWGRYALYSENYLTGSISNSPYAGYNTGENDYDQNALITVSHIFGPTLVNQTKLSFNRLNILQPLGTQPVSPTLYLAGAVPTIFGKQFALPGYVPYSQGTAIPFGGPQNVYQIADTVNFTHGNHSFVFGGEYIQARDNRVFGAYEEGVADLGKNYGNSLDALLAGTTFGYQVGIDPGGKFPCVTDRTTGALTVTPACTLTLPVPPPKFNRNNRYNDGALFVQDAWKANQRLTLNLGLRWDYFGPQHNANPALDSNFYYPGTLSPDSLRNGAVFTAPNSPIDGLWKSSYKNFGPRLGFAYDVTGDGKTSVRGGYGISYERNFGNVTFNVIQNPPNYGVVQLTSTAGFPLPLNNQGPFAGAGSKALGPVTLRGVDPNIKTAYAHQYSFSIEREVVPNTVVALEYSGSRGLHQYSITNPNRFFSGIAYNNDPATDVALSSLEAGRTNNQYGNINLRGSNGDSYYNGLNLRAQSSNFRRYGLQFTVNYTYSHSIDDLSSTFSETNSGGAQGTLGFLDYEHPGFDRGSSDYDVRHRVAFSAVYEPAFQLFKDKKWLKNAIGGFQFAPIFTFRSGTPFTLYDCANAFGICARQLNVGGAGHNIPISPSADPNAPNGAQPNSFDYFQPGPFQAYSAMVNGVDLGTSDVPSCINGVCSYPSNMLGRNTARVPSVWNMDLSAAKSFQLTERFQLQFRGEAFNLFNHSNNYLNYGTTDTESGGPITISKGTNALGERRFINLAIKLVF
ncbi:MAG: carboxypeptidase regulatory-like domain-containing protein [Acidobacteriaceae bacterium]